MERNILSHFQNSVSFENGFGKTGKKTGFSFKSKVAFSKTEVLKKPLLSKLSEYLFWDCNADQLDPYIDINMVLERVFSRGTENDEREIFVFYGKNFIKKNIVNIKYLDIKTLNYLSIILDIPKEEFACYKRSLSGNPFGIF